MRTAKVGLVVLAGLALARPVLADPEGRDASAARADRDRRIARVLFTGSAVLAAFAIGEASTVSAAGDEARFQRARDDYDTNEFRRQRVADALAERDAARRNAYIFGVSAAVVGGVGVWRQLAIRDGGTHRRPSRWWKIAISDALTVGAYMAAVRTTIGPEGETGGARNFYGGFALLNYLITPPLIHWADGDGRAAGFSVLSRLTLPISAGLSGPALSLEQGKLAVFPSLPYGLWVGALGAMAFDILMLSDGKPDGTRVGVRPLGDGGLVMIGGSLP
ncbi:MAG: hypothetical protein IPQ07_37765 [Myxococcales bacterium]|nr:hypothetical protein [Myxococcales bacterium]